MGTGYKGNADYHHSISENVGTLKENYKFSNGYFGDPGQGRTFTRNVASDDPAAAAKDFFDKAAYGGIVSQMKNGKGETVKMKDGTIISYREVSKSDGTPAVEINISNSNDPAGIKKQKIHFVKEGD